MQNKRKSTKTKSSSNSRNKSKRVKESLVELIEYFKPEERRKSFIKSAEERKYGKDSLWFNLYRFFISFILAILIIIPLAFNTIVELMHLWECECRESFKKLWNKYENE